MNGPSTRKMKLNRSVALAVMATLAFVASGCGSSSTGRDTPAAGSTSGGSGSAGVEAAKALVAQSVNEPTTIGPSEPLKTTPAKGKTFVWLKCELPQCALLSDGFESAAAALGWNYKTITFQAADPSSLIAAFKQALQLHPVGVSVGGIPQAVWQSVVPAYEAAGVPIIPLGIGKATLGTAVVGNVLTWDDYIKFGAINADWFIGDSNGSGHALIVNVPTYDILTAFTKGATDEIKKNCPNCASKELALSIGQVSSNQVNSAIVSALQNDPSIKYVLASNAPFVSGLVSALAAAGISGVKIAGNGPSVADEQGLLAGTTHAFTGENYNYESWNVVDVLLRHMQGLPIQDSGGGAPMWLLTKENVGTPSEGTNAPTNWDEQFKKLWLVGS